MAKFTKKHPRRRPPYSQSYIEDRRSEMYAELAKCETEAERSIIIKAFNACINP